MELTKLSIDIINHIIKKKTVTIKHLMDIDGYSRTSVVSCLNKIIKIVEGKVEDYGNTKDIVVKTRCVSRSGRYMNFAFTKNHIKVLKKYLNKTNLTTVIADTILNNKSEYFLTRQLYKDCGCIHFNSTYILAHIKLSKMEEMNIIKRVSLKTEKGIMFKLIDRKSLELIRDNGNFKKTYVNTEVDIKGIDDETKTEIREEIKNLQDEVKTLYENIIENKPKKGRPLKDDSLLKDVNVNKMNLLNSIFK